MRRGGMPLLGTGMGMGMGSPLLTGLMTGGIGYLLGRGSNQQQDPQVVQVMPPAYQQPPQAPQQAVPAPPSSADSERLAQLKLLGELRSSGVLTDEEFQREKDRILGR
jgi:hypothetical protein